MKHSVLRLDYCRMPCNATDKMHKFKQDILLNVLNIQIAT